MKTVWIILAVLVVLILGLGGCAVTSYNGLVSAEENADKSLSEIDNMLLRRADLIPNLVNTVKGYSKHEKEIFIAVADARSKLLGAKTVNTKAQALSGMNSAIGRLLAIAENYPQLKADTSFLRLQDELSGTENRIAVARSRYNESAKHLNAKMRKFPSVLFVSMAGVEKREYFEVADPKKKELPTVSFE
ncbi:MAG: LemA family protein [Lentisphaeria bacterium]|nr:LemA family protein [Lentisphaeria bacterium]NQZ70114.1 LemA family protein [Lentisphaeria bacterium]